MNDYFKFYLSGIGTGLILAFAILLIVFSIFGKRDCVCPETKTPAPAPLTLSPTG